MDRNKDKDSDSDWTTDWDSYRNRNKKLDYDLE